MKWRLLIAFLSSGLGLWFLFLSTKPTQYHGHIFSAGMMLWLGILMFRSSKDLHFKRTQKILYTRRRALLRLPLSIVLSLTPGALLIWFSLFAPDKPSRVHMGADLCDYAVGWCVSGNRSVIVWGIILLLIGLGVSYLIIRPLWLGRSENQTDNQA